MSTERMGLPESDLEKVVGGLFSFDGIAGILRQATWMIGIACGAWVIVTVLKMIGG